MTRGRPKFYPKVDQLFSITSSQSLSSGVSFTESYFWQCSQCTDYGILSDSILYLGLARFALQDAAFWCSYSNRRRLRTEEKEGDGVERMVREVFSPQLLHTISARRVHKVYVSGNVNKCQSKEGGSYHASGTSTGFELQLNAFIVTLV